VRAQSAELLNVMASCSCFGWSASRNAGGVFIVYMKNNLRSTIIGNTLVNSRVSQNLIHTHTILLLCRFRSCPRHNAPNTDMLSPSMAPAGSCAVAHILAAPHYALASPASKPPAYFRNVARDHPGSSPTSTSTTGNAIASGSGFPDWLTSPSATRQPAF
jgi:hypothetical protein